MFNEKRSSMLHGVLLIALFSCAAFYIGEMSFVRSLSFSPMIVGIILGMLYANSLRNNLPETWVPGIQFCSKKILRIGIILYGFRLTFQDVLAIGLPAMLIDVIIVVVTISILGKYWYEMCQCFGRWENKMVGDLPVIKYENFVSFYNVNPSGWELMYARVVKKDAEAEENYHKNILRHCT